MSQRVKTSARALVLTRSSQPENDHLRKNVMSYLRFLCVSVYIGVKHILCYIFALFFFVLWVLFCHFLRIVHF
jgi:hypothetical protein